MSTPNIILIMCDDMVYDLIVDPFEQQNVIAEHPDVAERMRRQLRETIASFRHSHHGGDYAVTNFQPANAFQEIWQGWSGE